MKKVLFWLVIASFCVLFNRAFSDDNDNVSLALEALKEKA
jgi:hypothetical protein